MGGDVALVLVVAARFVLPLAVFRFPLPAVLASLVLDAADQTLLVAFGADPVDYQGYDKAMDTYYLSLAYLATLRNWTHPGAFRVARFLFLWRLVGAAAYELVASPWLLLVFCNTFEYFFLCYEAVRLRWSPARVSTRAWVWLALGLTVVVKLPQEWWIHVAKLDVTTEVAAHPWTWPTLVVLAAALGLVGCFVVRPRVPSPDHPWRVAADPMPGPVDSAEEEERWRARHVHLWSWTSLEKLVLVALLCVAYDAVIPGTTLPEPAVAVGVVVVVAVNTVLTLRAPRHVPALRSGLVLLALRVVAAGVLIVLADLALDVVSTPPPVPHLVFYLVLVTLVATLHDRYQPVHELRALRDTSGSVTQPWSWPRMRNPA